MKNTYKHSVPSLKPSENTLNKNQPRVLARLLSLEITQKISGGASNGNVVCTGTA
jgi:hypothetical protein